VLEGEAHAPSKHADDLTERVLRFVCEDMLLLRLQETIF